MKPTKTFFLAAAAALSIAASALPAGAAVTTNLAGTNDIGVPLNGELIIQQDTATTYTGRLLSEGVSTYADLLTTPYPFYSAASDAHEPEEIGTIRIKGTGELEIQSWKNELNTKNPGDGGFYSARVFHEGRTPTYIFDPKTPGAASFSSFSGQLCLEDSVSLRISGYVNQYFNPNVFRVANTTVSGFDYDYKALAALRADARIPGTVYGVQRVEMKGTSQISFQNSTPNIPTTMFDDINAGPFSCNLRFNLIQNVESVGNETVFTTGLDDTYRIILHMDETYVPAQSEEDISHGEGSIGYLRGKGQFIKTGSGNFRIKNDATFDGAVLLNGGVTFLSSVGGRAVASAYTVNLTSARPGPFVDPFTVHADDGARYEDNVRIQWFGHVSPAGYVWPVLDASFLTVDFDPELSKLDSDLLPMQFRYNDYNGILAITTNQTIRNFQTYFRRNRGPDELFHLSDSEYGSVGTGGGTALFLSTPDANNASGTIDRTLRVYQDKGRDGYYQGIIVGSYRSVFEKYGEGTIAIIGGTTSPQSFSGTFDIQEGGLIADGQSLGSGWVNIGERGLLTIIQNNSGTLLAQLRAATKGELLITHSATIDNEDFSNVPVGSDYMIGVLQFYRAQPEFFGNLYVHGGVSILLSARDNDRISPNDAFANANSVTLQQGEIPDASGPGRQSVMAFADTNQRVTNFSGDPKTRVELGRGTITLRQLDKDYAYAGSIRGAGNVITVTDRTFTLSGENTYFGATVLKPFNEDVTGINQQTARLILGSQGGNTIKNTSALVLYRDTEVVSWEVDATGATVLDPETNLPRYVPQHFGMLFGEPASDELGTDLKPLNKAPKIDMGDATLTIGIDTDHLKNLEAELVSTPPNDDPNRPVVTTIQAAYFFNTLAKGEKQVMPANPKVTDFTVGTSRYYLETVLAKMTQWEKVMLDDKGHAVENPETGEFDRYVEKEGRGLSNADALAYAGEIKGSGSIVKVGDQRLIFSAQSLEFTGNLDVRDGIVRLNVDSFPKAEQVSVGVIRSSFDNSIVRYAVVEINVPAPLEGATERVKIFDSKIIGEGSLAKVGPGAMYLARYEHTGTTSVYEGELQLPVLPALDNVRLGYIDELTDAITKGTIGFEVPEGGDITHLKSIYEFDTAAGATGSVRKLGTGRLVLHGNPENDAGYALAKTYAGQDPLDPEVYPFQIENVEPAYRLTYSGTTYVDEGELVFSGKRWEWEKDSVTGEKLRPVFFANVPVATSNYAIAAGATLAFDVEGMFNDITAPAPVISGALSGAGTLRKYGDGTLVLATEQPAFTGALDITAGDLSLRAPYAIEYSGLLTIRDGARVLLHDNNQIFQNLAGDTGAVLDLGTANLILNTVPGVDVAYSGNIVGLAASTLTKNGAGILTLRGDNIGNFLGSVVITGGILDTTTRALGDATSISADFNATLRLHSDNLSPTPDTLFAPVENAGIVEKTGPGTVHLAWDGAPRNATGRAIHVAAGTLQLDTARNSNNVPVTIVDPGAIFQLNLQQDGYVSGGVRHEGTIFDGEITGGGSVTIDGLGKDRTLIMNKAPAYAGVTRIQNHAILDVSSISVLNGGIVSDTTSRLHFGEIPRLFTIHQSETGDAFAGTFTGHANLEITGPGILRYAGGAATGHATGDLSSYAGNITVKGGNLEVTIANAKPITLENGHNDTIGTLHILVPQAEIGAPPATYSAPLKGTGNVIKTGAGDLHASGMNFLYDPAFQTQTLAVDAGRIVFDTINLSRLQTLEIRPGGGVLWNPDPLLVGGGVTPSIGNNVIKSAPGTTLEKRDPGALLLLDQPEFKGHFLVKNGELHGNFKLGGDLTLTGPNTVLAPGESPGTVKVEGAFVLEKDATLKIEIQGADHDRVIYGTTARLDGIIEVSLLGGGEPERGKRFPFITKGSDSTQPVELGDSLALVVDTFDGYDASNLWFTLTTDPATGAPLILASQKQLARVERYTPHKSLWNPSPAVPTFLNILDSLATNAKPAGTLRKPILEGDTRPQREEYATKLAVWEKATAAATIGAALNAAPAEALPAVINNLSPLGYGSLISMANATAGNTIAQLSTRLEQRRYDRGLTYEDHEIQIYAIATGTYANLGGTNTDGPNYNYHTTGGIIGADYQFAARTTLGLVADYTNGKATFKNGGGDARMNATRATAYVSTIFGVDGWFFADGGLSLGYSDYDIRRNTVTGTNKATPDAWTTGAFFNLGTVFVVSTDTENRHRFNISPSLGVEYNHYEIYSSNETGTYSRLHVRAFDHDSLRAKIGANFNWFIHNTNYAADSSWKIGLDLRLTHELLDTQTTLDSTFAHVPDSGASRSLVSVDTLPADTIQITPSLSWNFTAKTSIFGSYQFEYGFDGQLYHALNLGFRHRF